MNHHDNRIGRRARRRGERGFSMLEALAAVGLLVILVYLLLRIFTNVQDVYSYSMNSATLFDNARVAFDIITRDLTGAVARENDIPGRDIRFHQPDSRSLWLVTSGEPSSAGSSEMLEVGYRLQAFELQRAFVDDSNAAWNIYGDRDDADDQDGYRRVIEGVLAQTIICYDMNMDEYMPSNDAVLPCMVSIILTLMDTHSFERWQALPPAQKAILERRTARTFRKTVNVGSGDF